MNSHSLSILLMIGIWALFSTWAIKNKVSINIHVKVFTFAFLLDEYLGVVLLGKKRGVYITCKV